MDWALPDDGFVTLLADFIPAGERAGWFERLRAAVPFEVKQIKILGRSVTQPRLTAWVGDASAVYTYSGVRHEPLAWPPELAELRERVASAAGVPFDSVLCNLYRDGRDSMGMHSDSERELGRNPVIASLSLGAVRRFQLRHRKLKGVGLDLDLPDGSLLIMRGALQHHYRHGVPKQPQIDAPRINLTFRRLS
ncbi:MAG TPA: alpha-ketoglutarate-dependent dioxygenase AlkB [Polyangiales bacterium]|nr:alpha-ketoglutarate-dependent dioxygenase AlkB [Polyangiales bacterium]